VISLVAIIVPAFNKENEVEEMLSRLKSTLIDAKIKAEIVVVDDGSTDATHEKLNEFSKSIPITILQMHSNSGKGSALRTGYQYALREKAHELIACIDADLDLHPEALISMLINVERGEADIFVGSKVHPQSEVSYPLKRRVLSRVFSGLTHFAVDLEVHDTQTGLKVFSQKALHQSLPHVKSSGFSFDLELLAIAHKFGFTIKEAPVAIDFQFSSSLGIRNSINALYELAAIAIRIRKVHRAT
jgi:glycosyltransferase involved in cell wall biosynthesis